MKKILSMLLVGAMSLSLLVGCGSSSDSSTDTSADASSQTSADADSASASETLDKSFPEETVKIGMEVYDTTAENYMAIVKYFDYLSQYLNVEFVYSESLANAEDEMSFIETCASAGCQGIIGFYNVAGAEAIQHCIDLGMYYWGTEEYYDQFATNDYYVGTYTFLEDGADSSENGDYLGGYEMGYGLAEAGVTHALYLAGGTSFGIQMFLDRQSGFEAGIAAAQADGYEIQYDHDADRIEGWPGTDDFTAALGKYLSMDYDGLASSFGMEAVIQPINDAGKADTIKCAEIGQVNDTFKESVESGLIAVDVYDCEEVVFGNAVVMILNAVTGHNDLNKDADGNALKVFVNRWTVKDAETYNAILDAHNSGVFYITADDVASCLGGYNDAATADSISELYGSWTVDKAIQ